MVSITVIALFLWTGIQYMRLTKPRRFWSWRVTIHPRLGPMLFIVLASVTAYLGYWLPWRIDSQFTPDIDSRIGMIVAGFAPFTTGMALWAIFSYIRLVRIQRRDPTGAGKVILAVLALPLAGSIYAGALVADAAFYFLPTFLESLLWLPLEWFGR
jgi:hypothetical protein